MLCTLHYTCKVKWLKTNKLFKINKYVGNSGKTKSQQIHKRDEKLQFPKKYPIRLYWAVQKLVKRQHFK